MLRRIVACLIPVILICFQGGHSAAAPAGPVDDLRKSVLALDSAWTRALGDLQQKKQGGALQEDEKRDYAKFVNYLSGRINDYCRQLRIQGGEQAVADLPCPEKNALPADGKMSFTPSATEKVAVLDEELTKALGEFDQQLLREEERLAARQPAEREHGSSSGASGSGAGPGSRDGAGQYGSGGLSGQGGQAGTGAVTSGSNTDGDGQSGNQGSASSGTGGSYSGQDGQASSGGAGAGTGRQESREQQPGQTRIEEGYDDIVARQLREAAEKETDPELREKLWDEYRKYKEGIR